MPQVDTKEVKAETSGVSPVAGMRGGRGTGYPVPGSGRPSLAGWHPSAEPADNDVLPDLEDLRAGSRDLGMNFPAIAAFLDKLPRSVVGNGLKLYPRPRAEMLGWTPEQTLAWALDVRRRFESWEKRCDASKIQTFGGLQRMAFRGVLESGEVFTLTPVMSTSGGRELRLQILEADQCATPPGKQTDATLAQGIEVDGFGRPVAYHFRDWRYGAFNLLQPQSWKRIRAIAPQSGRRQVLHAYRRFRPGQRRGVPQAAPLLESLKQLKRFDDAELAASVVQSFLTAFIKSDLPNADQFFGNVNAPGEDTPVKTQTDAEGGERRLHLGSGTIAQLLPGEDITLVNPNRPNDSYSPFWTARMKQLSAALNIPLEVLLGQFDSSYSAARAALLDFWQGVRDYRGWLVPTLIAPTYEEWMAVEVAEGRIVAPGFFEDRLLRDEYTRFGTIGPAPGMLDPLKETKADVEAVQEGFTTREEVRRSRYGEDWDPIPEQLGEERKRLDAAGHTAQGPATPLREEDRNDEEKDDNV